MTIPAFRQSDRGALPSKARIYLLEVKARDEPGGPVIAKLLIERNESCEYDKDGTVTRATIRLSFSRLDPLYSRQPGGNGHFDGSYIACNFDGPVVSVTNNSESPRESWRLVGLS